MRKVEVEWFDSNITHGWGCRDEVEADLMPISKSLGYLFSEGDEKTVLVMSYSDSEMYLERLAIPTGCIISLKELRVR